MSSDCASSPNAIGLKSQPKHRGGKTMRVNTEIHPSVKPTCHRDERLAKVADAFEAMPSNVEKIKARDVPDTKVRCVRMRATNPDQFSNVSPKRSRDAKIEEENTKFATSAEKVVLGARDVELGKKPSGKSKHITRDVHPTLAQEHTRHAEQECTKFENASTSDQGGSAGVAGGAGPGGGRGIMSKLGADDKPAHCRRGVVSGSGPLSMPKTTQELLSPTPDAQPTIVRRTSHPNKVMATFSEAISARQDKRRAAQEAQSSGDFLSNFSTSELHPFHPSKRVVGNHHIPHGYKPVEPVIGFPGMGAHSFKHPVGAKHFDPKKTSTHNDTEAEKKPRSERANRSLNSSHIFDVMEHPDHRPFSTRVRKPHLKSCEDGRQRPSARDSADAPEWWTSDARKAMNAKQQQKKQQAAAATKTS